MKFILNTSIQFSNNGYCLSLSVSLSIHLFVVSQIDGCMESIVSV